MVVEGAALNHLVTGRMNKRRLPTVGN